MTLSPFRSEITSNDARLLVLATEFSGETGDRLNRLLTSRSPVEAAAPVQSRASWVGWGGVGWWLVVGGWWSLCDFGGWAGGFDTAVKMTAIPSDAPDVRLRPRWEELIMQR